ncbi:outer membrane protein OmpA-like peptidoglycan-associated protein [Phyllobacterium sp. 1468]|uniref:OmpA family protein n=1 Tax=Phyllobacterium sp. 1468 TaxID=2817759 RepID=UPI00285B4B87|nr:OmpA family protein [Phyllobacterium sp. 1468]MDR6634563.1 outer membrane protein OmpA-like peptidoglycan-associated protein [Phyllobacterium sp. 1468]
MKRTALFFASTAILFSSPAAMAEQTPINRPFISSNSNVPSQMLAQAEQTTPQAEEPVEELKKHKGGDHQAEEAKKRAADETEAAAKEQRKAEEQAKHQADQAAKAAEKENEQKAEEAKRAANAEADKAAKQQNAIEEEAKQKAAQEAKSAKAAEKEAAQEAEKAKRATEAESDKAAKQQKAVEEEARKKAAAESDAAKAAEKQTAKEAEKVKKTTEQEADKSAEAQKAAEEEARKKTDSAQKAADKQTDKAAEEAKKAADKAAKPAAPAPDSPATAEQPSQAAPAEPATKEAKPVDPSTGKAAQQEALPENAAPALDSAKRAPSGETPGSAKQGQTAQSPADQKNVAQQPAVAAPKSDADVQQELAPVKIEPVLTEKGTRTKDRRPDERPGDVQVVKKFGDRTVVNIDNNVYVESSDRPRMSRDSKDVYYEDLPRNRTRETIVRDNGVQIVTIRNRYGDVIRRSRVMPDGHEIVLTYTPDYDREERLEWRDPGDDLPPLALNIPVGDYILDAEEAPQEEVYDFFEQPPVERVERIYSIDEVKRSARIRDKVRRVDLDTITFQFGSADIGEDQISHIESVAKAMAQILKKNPAETFLIEGHTDAVGSDQANLVLSDRRAESVAQALTNVFDIPPENMATQGYGEQYLKIKADGPEQENRRVAIRRITPLVTPVASN